MITAIILALLSPQPQTVHVVAPGDTLYLIAQDYLGDGSRWGEIQAGNNLKTTNIEVGQVLVITREFDWETACQDSITGRLTNLRKKSRLPHVLDPIPNAINRVDRDLNLAYTPMQKLKMCRYAMVTAERESMYQFAVGGVGEIGMYQFRLSTARQALSHVDRSWLEASDEKLVTYLLNYENASYVFVLHFYSLLERTDSVWHAWRRYNGAGEQARTYANNAVARYREIFGWSL